MTAWRPEEGRTVYRPVQARVDRPGERITLGYVVQRGLVLSVKDDPAALDGWVALVRWTWRRGKRPHTFEAVEATAFDPDHAGTLAITPERASSRPWSG